MLTLVLLGIAWWWPELPGRLARSLVAGRLVSALSVFAVLLAAGWHRRAAGLGWPWLLLALAVSLEGWAILLAVVPATLLPHPTALLPLVVLSLASLITVAGPARIWAAQTLTVGNTLQRVLESGIVIVVALMLLPSVGTSILLPTALTPALVMQLLSASLFLGGLIPLLVVGPSMTRFLGGASLGTFALAQLGLMVMAAPPSWMAPLASGSWVLLALAAAAAAGPASPQGDPWTCRARDDGWRGTVLVQLGLVLGLGRALVAPLPDPPLVIGLITLTLLVTSCWFVRHQATMRRWRRAWQHEQAAFHHAQATEQQHLHALARLIHDLGPPVQGVSSIADQLLCRAARDVRASPATVGERLGQHADHLEHLIRQLTTRLRRQDAPPMRHRRIDALIIATLVVESMHPLAHQRRIDLSLALGTDATELWGNAHALRRILDNLVSNAL
ncbi:MAG: HAMP domain-containing histidine kinase, partial [Opitutae bacterium]|nr:HAMP domain-containing histidine kinase [Opitutae bacterium]